MLAPGTDGAAGARQDGAMTARFDEVTAVRADDGSAGDAGWRLLRCRSVPLGVLVQRG